MWGVVGTYALKFLRSRTGMIVLIVSALWTWHTLDKGSAVREAVVGYVADVELAAAEAKAETLQGLLDGMTEANAMLARQTEKAQKEAADAVADREEYLGQTSVPAGCVVGDDLLGILRAN